MKNILILGDSIRQNYQEYVKTKLSEVANVYFTIDNGRFCQYTLRYLHDWIRALSDDGKIKFDIIHFNCGLWDVLRLSNENVLFTDEEQYAILLERIVKRMQYLSPYSKIIFALTTEVVEPGFEPGVSLGERRNEDIRRYNEIAREVCSKLDIEIDDLWSISRKLPEEAHSDLVHFETTLGIQALGDQVVSCLGRHCAVE